MRRITSTLLALVMILSIAVCAAACSTNDKPNEGSAGIQITDQIGRTVTLDGVPQRIISIAPANTEILFALGLGDKIVGVTQYCNYPAEASEKEQVGGFSTPDIEKIVSLEPDVVFAAPIHETDIIPQLEDWGIEVIALAPETIEEALEAIELAGTATGAEDAAAALVEDMQDRIDAVCDLVANLSADEIYNVFYLVWHDPLMTAGGNTLQSQLIELAGGINIYTEQSDYPDIDPETLLVRNPHTIIVGTGHGSGQNAPLEWALTWEPLSDTDAGKYDNIFEIDSDITSRFGPRIVDGLEEVFRLIHPELADEIE